MRRLTYTAAAALLANVAAWAVAGRGELPPTVPGAWPEWEYVAPGDSVFVHSGLEFDGDSITAHGLSEESVSRTFEGVRTAAGPRVAAEFSSAPYSLGSEATEPAEGVPWRLVVLPLDPWPLTRDVAVELSKPLVLDGGVGISYGHLERYVYVFGWRRLWTSGLRMA